MAYVPREMAGNEAVDSSRFSNWRATAQYGAPSQNSTMVSTASAAAGLAPCSCLRSYPRGGAAVSHDAGAGRRADRLRPALDSPALNAVFFVAPRGGLCLPRWQIDDHQSFARTTEPQHLSYARPADPQQTYTRQAAPQQSYFARPADPQQSYVAPAASNYDHSYMQPPQQHVGDVSVRALVSCSPRPHHAFDEPPRGRLYVRMPGWLLGSLPARWLGSNSFFGFHRNHKPCGPMYIQRANEQDDNDALRARLSTKTGELFDVRRQLDRALEMLREQDAAYTRQTTNAGDSERELDAQNTKLAQALAENERMKEQVAVMLKQVWLPAHKSCSVTARGGSGAQELARARARACYRRRCVRLLPPSLQVDACPSHCASQTSESERSKIELERRVTEMTEDLGRCESTITSARGNQAQTESDCEFRLNIMKQRENALETELDALKDQLNGSERRGDQTSREKAHYEAMVEDLKLSLQQKNEQCDALNRKIGNWADEAERLRGALDGQKRQLFDTGLAADAQNKSSRMELHQLQAKITSLEVERQTLASDKQDLIHQVSRMMRRGEERDEQIRRLTRVVEQKDQSIAELKPLGRESKRASSQASRNLARTASAKGWRR